MNEPIRHHYIPQFILRNFCFNNHGEVRYYCKKTNVESVANTRDVFMERNLYRDEINSPNDPTSVQKRAPFAWQGSAGADPCRLLHKESNRNYSADRR